MQFQEQLAKKFKAINLSLERKNNQTANINDTSNNFDLQAAPVVQAMYSTYQGQSQKLDQLIAKKRNQQKKWARISSANLDYRERLRNKIQQEQERHEKKRREFLSKRVKDEKFKSTVVNEKRDELFEKQKAANQHREQQFKKFKSKTIQYWSNKEKSTEKAHARQTAAQPLYEDSIERKKGFESDNIRFSIQTKQSLLKKHAQAFERKQKSFVIDKKPLWEDHHQQCYHNYHKNEEILDQKHKHFITTIGFTQDRSKSLQKQNKQSWEKKLKGRLIDQMDLKQKIHENLMTRTMTRAHSMRDCRCHKKGSILKIEDQERVFDEQKNQNEQQLEQSKKKSKNNLRFKKSSLPLFTRSSFLSRQKINENVVNDNKSRIKERQDYKNQRKLMLEQQISEACRNRKNVLNQGNCILRVARING